MECFCNIFFFRKIDVIFRLSRAWNKENVWVLDGNRMTSQSPEGRSVWGSWFWLSSRTRMFSSHAPRSWNDEHFIFFCFITGLQFPSFIYHNILVSEKQGLFWETIFVLQQYLRNNACCLVNQRPKLKRETCFWGPLCIRFKRKESRKNELKNGGHDCEGGSSCRLLPVRHSLESNCEGSNKRF